MNPNRILVWPAIFVAGLALGFAPGLVPPAHAEEKAQERVRVQVKQVLLVNDAPAVLLVDPTEREFLLVFIDFFMAHAIRTGMEAPALERPLTHDLIGIFLRRLGAKLARIDITALKSNTYYALITLQVNGNTQQIDSRPSDALAIAVRNHTPIYVNRALLKPVPPDSPEQAPLPESDDPDEDRPQGFSTGGSGAFERGPADKR